jgi:predicted transposase/invertase (TIGR01784 family)
VIQVRNDPAYEKGKAYVELNHVIALTITGFNMFKETDTYRSHFSHQEETRRTTYPNCSLELIIIELPKFKWATTTLTATLQEKWVYFLKDIEGMSTLSKDIGEVPEMTKAFEMAEIGKLSADELTFYGEELRHRHNFVWMRREKKGKKKGNKMPSKRLPKRCWIYLIMRRLVRLQVYQEKRLIS